jgi:BirA family transcriptional regulator, biotin operon repressor / biotin---[acetyl-CoA-carboxylase] ligase
VDSGGHEHVITAGDGVHLRPWTPPVDQTGGYDGGPASAESGYA